MKNFLLHLTFFFLTASAFGQAVAWELSAEPGDQASSTATFQSNGYVNCTLTRGAGITASTGAGSMNASGWFSGIASTTLANAIAGNDYYEFTCNTTNCLFFDLNNIKMVLRSSATGPNTATLRCSSDGFTADLGTATVGTTASVFTFTDGISPNSQSVTYRLYGYGDAAGGGLPSSGGTMRIGTSAVAGDNDLELFGSTTLINVAQVTSFTVTSGDFVPATVFSANVPGATINWSRTPEVFGLSGISGTNLVPSFTATNNTSGPITCTFTVNATVGNCTSPDMIFTITVNRPPCTISTNFLGDPGPCDDNGTPNDPSDDFFTQSVQAQFLFRPTTGNLQIVPGGDEIGVYSIPVNQTIGNSHIFFTVKFKADGTPTNIQMNFTDEPGCIDAAVGPTVQPCSTPPPSCTITANFLGDPGPCNDNGTPNDPSDDFFTQNIQAQFLFRPATGNLQIVPGGDEIGVYSIPVNQTIGNSHIFFTVKFKADGTPTNIQMNFTDDPGCIDAAVGPTVQSCSSGGGTCSISNVSLINVGSCNDNGTSDPTDDYFTADVRVTYVNPPATGNLEIELPGDVVPGGGATSIPVANLVGSPHTFTGVRFKADGTVTGIEVRFTADQSCVRTVGAATVQPCSFTPPVLTCPGAVSVSCANEAPAVNPASVVETHTCPGNVTITHLGDVNSNVTCINRLTITRTYQGVDQCGNTATCSQAITLNDQTPPIVTCPANLVLSCASQVPVVDVTALGVTDNCVGSIGISRSFVSESTTGQTCTNRFTLTRIYKGGDGCLNTATCTQTITVNDQTPPSLTCPGGQTVSCAEQVPAANSALVTGLSDNCGGATPTVTFIGDAISNQTCANRFTVARTYRATDACGNAATCTQVITVNDQTPPTFTFVPANTTVDCYLIPPAGTPTASDNCTSGATVAFLGEVKTNGICPVLFTLTRTWRATDACGNSATASQVVTVTDTNAPQFIVFPKNTVVECGPNNATEFQTFLDAHGGAVAEDCSPITFSHTDSPIQNNSYNCGNTFRINIRFIATDLCGNASFRDASFTVVDLTPPVFSTPPQNVQLECDDTDDNGESAFYDWLDSNAGVVAEDACGDVTLEKVLISEYHGCGNTWKKTYEFRAKDQCDNLAKTTATFAVVDNTPPAIVCPPNENVYLPCLEDVPAADPTSLDVFDCSGISVTLKDTWTNGTGCPNFPMTVAYRYAAVDACGNEAICERAYYVKETKSPALVCPDTIKIVCVKDIPGPLQLFGYIKTLLAGDCAGGFTSITILSDSGQPQNGAMHRTYSITAKNHCGLVTTACSVTFLATGSCNQLCTASQGSWGDPNGNIAGMNTSDAIDQLIQLYGPVKVGGGGHTVTAATADCVQEMLFGSGTNTALPTGHFTCPLPASLANPDGSLNNQLAANAMALQLNIWYNSAFNGRNFGGQDINNLPPCLVEFPLLKELGQHTTVQDLLDLTNQYLQNFAAYYSPDLPGYLNAALDNLNYFRVDCEQNAPCERPGRRSPALGEPGEPVALRVFPNPVSDVVNIAFWSESAGSVLLKITDMPGESSVQNVVAVRGLNTTAVSLKNLAAGIYWVSVQTGTGVETVRVAKVRE